MAILTEWVRVDLYPQAAVISTSDLQQAWEMERDPRTVIVDSRAPAWD